MDWAAARAGYYGRDEETQRARHENHALGERVNRGQILVGSPETVWKRVQWLRDEIAPGILELNFSWVPDGRTHRSMELFAKHVLPRMREL